MKKKPPLFAIILLSIVILVVLFQLYMTFFFSLSSDAGTYRTNQMLILYFNIHKHTLMRLNEELLVYAKMGLNRIDDDWTRPDDLSEIGIDNDTLDRLRELFVSMDMSRGISCGKESIKYILHSWGLSITGGSEGFLYSVKEPVNFFNYNESRIQKKPFPNIDSVVYPERGSYYIYIKIQDNWYIYNEYED